MLGVKRSKSEKVHKVTFQKKRYIELNHKTKSQIGINICFKKYEKFVERIVGK